MEIPCAGTAVEIYSRLKTRLQQITSERTIEQLQELTFHDQERRIVAKGTGFRADLTCSDGKVVLNMDLGLLLRPLRSKIEQELIKRLRLEIP
jgi:hypothetical protein